MRDVASAKLYDVLQHNMSSNVEQGLYDYACEFATSKGIPINWENLLFVHIYKQKFLLLLQKLHDDCFVQSILDGNVLPKEVPYTSDFREQDTQQEEVADGIFECRKCGSKKTTYYSLQTRSADEPMTNFITCVKCNHRWKM
jgi:DNA-directed RNA polymerase subunit M/transcription elongation factor TFIIS